jgi:cysteine desulfurase
MTSYFDCAATTPIDPEAYRALLHYVEIEYGNAGSRTHEYGLAASRAVKSAREKVAALSNSKPEEVIFTSGATEANNLAILGIQAHGLSTGKRHIVTTAIEHKAVLEPVSALIKQGFEVTFVAPQNDGRVTAEDVMLAVRPDTLIVSVMHANNETGALQPIDEIAAQLRGHSTFLHVDAAQTYGKSNKTLTNTDIDMISVSGHKIFAPKGIGALIIRRGQRRPPLTPLFFGGGQERGLRPGTLPVPLIAAFGAACGSALREAEERQKRCIDIRHRLLETVLKLGGEVNGHLTHCLPSTLNVSFPGLDSEAVLVVLKDLIAISNGSACTSASYAPSHVLVAMGLSEDRVESALRFSWCHMTKEPSWDEVASRINSLK